MIPKQCVKIRWNSRYKNHYIDRGYTYTKNNAFFWVDTDDLQPKSGVKITVVCDYCGCFIEKPMAELTRSKEKDTINKDCCTNCVPKKMTEFNLFMYGVESSMHREEVKMKHKKTIFDRYGVENASQIEGHNDKVTATSLKNYGVNHPTQSEVVVNKRRATNLVLYGHICALQNPAIKERIALGYFETGNVKTSKQQLGLYELLNEEGYNAILNYPVSSLSLDVAILIGDIKINIEYDGWYWHQESKKDRKRDEYLKSQGWKILRIKSGRNIPDIGSINTKINKLLNKNYSYQEIILEDWINQSSKKTS